MRERIWNPKAHKPARPGAPKRVREASDPRDKSRFAPKPKPPKPTFEDGVAILYGWHPVSAALAQAVRDRERRAAPDRGRPHASGRDRDRAPGRDRREALARRGASGAAA